MSRSNARTAITFVAVVALAVAAYELPRVLRDRAAQDAVHDVVEDAAREAARKVAAEALPQAARETVDQVKRDIEKQEARPAAPPAPVPKTPPLLIDRAAYKITMPADSTVELDTPELDKDHFTEVDLPTGGSIIITAVDSKERAGPEFDKLTSNLKGKLQDPTVADTHTFDLAKATRSTAMSGKIEGRRMVFETAMCEGNTKACLMILQYGEEKKPETVALVRTALATFKMKD